MIKKVIKGFIQPAPDLYYILFTDFPPFESASSFFNLALEFQHIPILVVHSEEGSISICGLQNYVEKHSP